MIHVGITGSKEWTEVKKIKDFLFILNQKYKQDIEIITCGERSGVDYIVKKCCNDLGMIYKESRMPHYEWTHYCKEPANFYKKKYFPNNIYVRNSKFISYCDILILYIDAYDQHMNNFTNLESLATKKNIKIKKNIS